MRPLRNALVLLAGSTLALAAPRTARAQDAPAAEATVEPTVVPSATTAVESSTAAESSSSEHVHEHVHLHVHHHGRHGGDAMHGPPSLSMGYANGGRLANPARLEEDDTIRYLPGRRLHYGTDELVGLIRRAARTVQRRHHARLTVGDLSAAGGGPVGHHASHQSGRDADLAFYIADRHGDPVLLDDLVAFGRNGRPLVDPRPLRFDAPRNWALIDALLNDPAVRVEHVFVSNAVRAYLLGWARATGADGATIARAEAVLHQPSTGSPHTNHFHVRIACPSGDAACVEGVRPRPRRRRHGEPGHHAEGRARASR